MLIFLECNIKPIIILDGGFDKSDRKFKTCMNRLTDRLTQVQYIAKHGCSSGKVLPILSYEVFRSVLMELGIVFAQCDYEADDQVMALANYYNCPVISADSDFYIFDIHKGFIHLDSIEMIVNLDIDADGKEYKFLNCNIYHVDEFVTCFPGINKSILPLFGTLLGNDFVHGKEFHNFFSNIQLPKYKGRKLILNSNHKKMIGLLCWLKNNTLNEALSQVMLHLKKDKRERIKTIIEDSVKVYNSDYSNLSYIIDKRMCALETELPLNSRLTTSCGYRLPADFVFKFHSGIFPPYFTNVICMHRVLLQPQVENISYPSSYACSRYIRQVLYGILVHHDTDDGECENIACHTSIEEYDRQKGNLRKEYVEPVFSVDDILLPKLNELSNLQIDKCKFIMYKILGISPDFYLNLPDKWQLLIGCIKFWLCNCTPYSSEAVVYAVILNLIYFDIIKCKQKPNYQNNLCKISTEHNCSNIACLLSNVKESDLQFASKNMKKYTQKPSFNNGNPLILHIVHSYSQLQTCVLFITYLNKLLGNSMESPDPHRCLGGTLLYNLARDIETRSNPELFIAEMLGRQRSLHQLFSELYSKICQNVPSECIVKIDSSKKPKKSKKMRNIQLKDGKKSFSDNNFDVLANRI